jgi:hypothetical protein
MPSKPHAALELDTTSNSQPDTDINSLENSIGVAANPDWMLTAIS